MTPGRPFAVVGASGVGKDTLIGAVMRARPDLYVVRRVITRPEDAGGEPFEGVTPEEFQRRADAGDFALSWVAHGLSYGIPTILDSVLASGRDAIFNGSRAALPLAVARYPRLRVLNIVADARVLAARLAARGREDAASRALRLGRADRALPDGLDVVEIDNGGALERSVEAFLTALQPERV